MTRHELTVKGIRISYLEINPTADKTILFIHGNSISSAFWQPQFSSPLLSGYRLLVPDLPAHGSSGASADPDQDYSLPGMGALLAEFTQMAISGPYITCGVSLGSNIQTEMLPHGARPAGLFLAGPCVMGSGIGVDRIALPGADISVLLKDEATVEEIGAYGAMVFQVASKEWSARFISDYQQVQPPFRTKFLPSVLAGRLSDEIALVKNAGIPMCWVFGADEKVIDPFYLDGVDVPKWDGAIHRLPNAGHLVNNDAPEAFNALLAEFAGEVLG